jgi:hypothetical protein
MKARLGLTIVLALLATPALAQRITIDYDKDFDFDKVETFAYVETKDSDASDQLIDGRIEAAIVKELTEGGLRQVESDADLFVTYHLTTKENTVLNTTGYGYGGYGGGWGRYGGVGMTSATTTVSTYTEGTIIVDAYEPGEKKMVWRGTGTVTVKSKPEKQTKQISNIMTKMGDKWDKILAKQGK